jgi:hypothetical protein
MVRQRSKWLYSILVVLFLLSFSVMFVQFGAPVAADENASVLLQEDVPVPTQPPPTPLPPAEIPEPITVILFGTGLAALSAAAARRKKAE